MMFERFLRSVLMIKDLNRVFLHICKPSDGEVFHIFLGKKPRHGSSYGTCPQKRLSYQILSVGY